VPVVVKMKGLSGFAFTLAISSRTSGESGTVCARPFFVLLPGCSKLRRIAQFAARHAGNFVPPLARQQHCEPGYGLQMFG
jgi:hypothetical protein